MLANNANSCHWGHVGGADDNEEEEEEEEEEGDGCGVGVGGERRCSCQRLKRLERLRFLIATPVRNCEAWIRYTIESVRAQVLVS